MRSRQRLARSAALLLLALGLAAGASGRPYQVDDMLRLSDYGQVMVDPGERWAVVVKRDPYDSAPAYRLDYFVRRLLSKVHVADLRRPAGLEPLFAQEAGAGYWLGRFSPSGARLTVFRLKDDLVSVGVVDMARRTVAWLPLAADLPRSNPAPIWLDEHRLLVAALAAPGLAPQLAQFWAAERDQAELRARTAGGVEPAVTAIGSGRFLGTHDRPAARRLLVADLSAGTLRPVHDGAVEDVAVAPGGRQAALLVETGEIQPQATDAAIDPGFQTARRGLLLLDLETGTARRACAGCDVLPHLLAWSPSGDTLLVFARTGGQRFEDGRLYRVRARDGWATALDAPGLRPVLARVQESALVVRAAWAGARPVALLAPEAGGRPDWFALGGSRPRNLTAALPTPPAALAAIDAAALFLVADGRLWRAPLDGPARPLGPAAGSGVTRLDIYAAGNRAFLSDAPSPPAVAHRDGADATTVLLARGPGALARVALPAGARLLAVAPHSHRALSYTESASGVGRLWLSGPEGATCLETLNAHLADVTPPRLLPLRTRDDRGDTLTHWLYLPADARGPLPLVVIPYLGDVHGATPPPLGASTMLMPVNRNILVGHGYAVLVPSLPLAPGPGDPLDGLAPRVLAAVDAAVATGRIDPARIAAYGHSYGGYTALGLAAQTDRFRTVIASAAPADLLAGYGAPVFRTGTRLEEGLPNHGFAWFEGGQGRMGAPPWRAFDRYRQNSPLYSVADIHVPVLLIHGGSDYIPVAVAERMFAALYRLGRDALLLRYWGEGHQFASPANIRDCWERIFAWLDATLAPPSVRLSERPPRASPVPNSAPSIQGSSPG